VAADVVRGRADRDWPIRFWIPPRPTATPTRERSVTKRRTAEKHSTVLKGQADWSGTVKNRWRVAQVVGRLMDVARYGRLRGRWRRWKVLARIEFLTLAGGEGIRWLLRLALRCIGFGGRDFQAAGEDNGREGKPVRIDRLSA